MKRVTLAVAAVTLSLMGTGVATHNAVAQSSRCPLPTFGPGSDYQPTYDRTGFTAHVTNPWFPLPVGRTYIYTGVDGTTASQTS